MNTMIENETTNDTTPVISTPVIEGFINDAKAGQTAGTMITTLESKELLRALRLAKSAVARRNTLPILGAVVLESNGTVLRLTTTNLDQRLTVLAETTTETPGTALVDLRTLLAWVAVAPKGLITLTTESGKLKAVASGVQASMALMDPADYPLEVVAGMESECMIGRDDLAAVAPGMSSDASRYILNAVLFAPTELIATDGKRLHVMPAKGPAQAAIVPCDAVSMLLKAAKRGSQVRALFGARKARFIGEGFTLESRLVEGNYPNWRQVVPNDNELSRTVNTARLIQAVKSAAVGCTGDKQTIRLGFMEDCLQVSPVAKDGTPAVSIVPGVGQVMPERMGIDPAFLLDALESAGESATLRYKDACRPLLIDGANGFQAVVMPCRLA